MTISDKTQNGKKYPLNFCKNDSVKFSGYIPFIPENEEILEDNSGCHSGKIIFIKKVPFNGQEYDLARINVCKKPEGYSKLIVWIPVEKLQKIQQEASTVAGGNLKGFTNQPKEKIKESKKYITPIKEDYARDKTEWDSYVQGLSQEAIISDQDIKKIIDESEKIKINVLVKAFNELKKYMKDSAKIELTEKAKIVSKPEEDSKVEFGIKVENKNYSPLYIEIGEVGAPNIVIPEETKTKLKELKGNITEIIRAKLIIFQEDRLNQIDNYIKAVEKRNKLLRKKEKELDEYISSLSLFKIAMLKKLVNDKYKKIS